MALSYAFKRILWTIPTLLVMALISFGIVSLMPGDFFTPCKLAAAEAGFDPEEFHGAARALLFIFGIYKWCNPLIVVPYLWGVCDWNLRGAPLTWTKVGSHIIHLMPAWILVAAPAFAYLARILRMEIREQLPTHYVRTARGKGLGECQTLTKHALRNALNPVISMSGYIISAAISWSILACGFLGLPALGTYALLAARSQDQFLFTATLVLYGVLLTVGILLSDIVLAVSDPRIRYD